VQNPAGSPINTLLGIMARSPCLPLNFAGAKKSTRMQQIINLKN
jgi:hypothetical protein